MNKPNPTSKPNDTLSILADRFRYLKNYTTTSFIVVIIIQLSIFAAVFGFLLKEPFINWSIKATISTVLLFLLMLLILGVIARTNQLARVKIKQSINEELIELRSANKRALALQDMANTLSATLSFERVMDVALEACNIVLDDMGIPKGSLVSAVFLFEEDYLVPVASRRFMGRDNERRIMGQKGVIGKALQEAEPTVSNKPADDPELKQFVAFNACYTVIALPLRAGFQIFGAMVIGTEIKTTFTQEHLDLFHSVSAQAVIALQNAQLYQNLESEKQRIIEADEEARKELARNLHDGPTQSVAAITMRLSFIQTLLPGNIERAAEELHKIEQLAKNTSQEIRGMLFTLRPLILETQGLGAALEKIVEKLREMDNLNIRLLGTEYTDLLNERAQGTIFYIIEEALGNARKYSKASLIEIRLWREGNLFVARIQDNGVGFDVEAVYSNYSARGSLGMINLRERAERIDGSVKVESVIGKGTTVTLVVPLDKQGRLTS